MFTNNPIRGSSSDVASASHGCAQHKISDARVAPQQRLERGEQHHERSDVLLAAELNDFVGKFRVEADAMSVSLASSAPRDEVGRPGVPTRRERRPEFSSNTRVDGPVLRR